MQIENCDDFISSHKEHSLRPLAVTVLQGLLPGVKDLGESDKVTHQWDFYADGEPCSIWDYYGVRWSGFGPKKVFQELGLL